MAVEQETHDRVTKVLARMRVGNAGLGETIDAITDIIEGHHCASCDTHSCPELDA